MNSEQVLRRILDHLEGKVDPVRARRVAEHHRAALDYKTQEIPPLVLFLPYEGAEFKPYPYAEAFDDPAKMMVNELLAGRASIWHAVDFGGDTPCCLRPNVGTGIVASLFGAEIRLTDNNMPWVEPIGVERIRRAVAEPMPDLQGGLMPQVIAQYAFFKAMLADYPKCREAFNITLPDLQGPFDTAAMLWGSEIFEALYTQQDLVSAFLQRIAETMLAVHDALVPYTADQLYPHGQFQHTIGVKGKLLIREDSAAVMISPAMYREIIRPANERLAATLGSVGFHFCGNGRHQVDNLLDIPGVVHLDFGQAYLMDIDEIYAKAAARRVPLSRVTVPEEQLTAARVKQRFPTGVLLCAAPRTLADARRMQQRYLAEV